MNVYIFLKSLKKTEREALAAELSHKPELFTVQASYLTFLASKGDHMSIKLAGKIYDSKFNQSRHRAYSFTEHDWRRFHKHKSALRNERMRR